MLLDRAFLDPLAFPQQYGFRYEAALLKHPATNARPLMNINKHPPYHSPFVHAMPHLFAITCNAVWHHTGMWYGRRGHQACPPSRPGRCSREGWEHRAEGRLGSGSQTHIHRHTGHRRSRTHTGWCDLMHKGRNIWLFLPNKILEMNISALRVV